MNDEGKDKRETEKDPLDFGGSDFCDVTWFIEEFLDPSFPSPRYS